MIDAEHAEDTPDAAHPVIVPVACALPGPAAATRLEGALAIDLRAGSRLRALYGVARIHPLHQCGYEVNPEYRERFERAGMRTVGTGPAGEVRAVELEGHPFFVGTLFQPQRLSRPDAPDPLVRGFLAAASGRRSTP